MKNCLKYLLPVLALLVCQTGAAEVHISQLPLESVMGGYHVAEKQALTHPSTKSIRVSIRQHDLDLLTEKEKDPSKLTAALLEFNRVIYVNTLELYSKGYESYPNVVRAKFNYVNKVIPRFAFPIYAIRELEDNGWVYLPTPHRKKHVPVNNYPSAVDDYNGVVRTVDQYWKIESARWEARSKAWQAYVREQYERAGRDQARHEARQKQVKAVDAKIRGLDRELRKLRALPPDHHVVKAIRKIERIIQKLRESVSFGPDLGDNENPKP